MPRRLTHVAGDVSWDPDDLGEKIQIGVSNEESRRRERVQVECALCACGAEALRLGDLQRGARSCSKNEEAPDGSISVDDVYH